MSESPFLEAVATPSDDAASSVAVDMPTSNEEAIEATDVAYDGATDVDLDGEVSTARESHLRLLPRRRSFDNFR